MLLVPQSLAAMPALWRRYFGILIILFFPILTPQIHFKAEYGWTSVQKKLAKPMTFYKLNPNELIQLVPNLGDTITYKVINKGDLQLDENTAGDCLVVSKMGKIDSDKFVFVGKAIWNNNIYLFNVKNADLSETEK